MTEIRQGDARELMAAMAAGSVDMVFTDPPYGHNNNNGDLISRREAALGVSDYVPERDNRPIAQDGVEANELFRAGMRQVGRILKPGGVCCCCCGGGGPDPQFARWSLWLDELIGFKMAVVWDKGPMGMGWHYRRSYEMILVAQKPGAACKWYDETNSIENVIRPGFGGIHKIIPAAHQHPTEKPWQLAAHFIRLHSQPGGLVVDPFCGAGSTGEACKRLRRNFVGIDIDARWCEMARKRCAEDVTVEMF